MSKHRIGDWDIVREDQRERSIPDDKRIAQWINLQANAMGLRQAAKVAAKKAEALAADISDDLGKRAALAKIQAQVEAKARYYHQYNPNATFTPVTTFKLNTNDLLNAIGEQLEDDEL